MPGKLKGQGVGQEEDPPSSRGFLEMKPLAPFLKDMQGLIRPRRWGGCFAFMRSERGNKAHSVTWKESLDNLQL